jgi:hypothetical protein
MTHGGVWGEVCGDYFDDKGAAVVCRQLGLKGGRRPARHTRDTYSYFNNIWMDKFICDGSETSLGLCTVSAREEGCRSGPVFVCCDGEVICVNVIYDDSLFKLFVIKSILSVCVNV